MTQEDPRDEDAQFVAELTRCQSPLELYVRGLMPGDPAAEEVVQQANAKIWLKRADFELGTNFRAWALSIARFEVLNYRKQQARDARLRFSDELEQTIATEMAELEDDLAERQTALQECLGELKPESRELLIIISWQQPIVDTGRDEWLGRRLLGDTLPSLTHNPSFVVTNDFHC